MCPKNDKRTYLVEPSAINGLDISAGYEVISTQVHTSRRFNRLAGTNNNRPEDVIIENHSYKQNPPQFQNMLQISSKFVLNKLLVL